MKRELSGGITSRKRFAGKSDFSAKQVSTTLLLLLLCMFMPQGVKASFKEYKFADLAQKAYEQNGNNGTLFAITMGESYSDISSGQYGTSTTFGDLTVDLSKFAFRNNNNNRGWDLERFNDNDKGLYWHYDTPDFAITKLRPNDEVTVYYRSNGNRTATFKLRSGSASWMDGSAISADAQLGTVTNGDNSFKFKATAGGDIIIYASTNAGTAFLTKVEIYRPDVASYAYDPAIETYDLTGKTWTISEGASAGYSFAIYAANYISNPSGYELNNRIAIQYGLSGSWSYANGLKSGKSYRLLGISDLRDGDRVRVTFSGNIKFSSRHEVDKIETSFLVSWKGFL